MSTLKVNNLQVGQDGTASNNYTLYQPASPDGTVRLGYGVAGSVTDILTLKNSRLGIGTDNPEEDLHIASNSPYILLDDIDNSRKWRLKGTAWFSIEDTTVGEDRLRIDSSGRVLLGATTEGEANADDLTVATSGHTGMTIRSGTANRGNIYFSDGTSGDAEYRGYVTYDHDGDKFKFGTANADRLVILSDGKVGINSATPAVQLHINSTDAIRVPVGTTGERPTGAAGYIRYNSSIASYEGHNGSEWAGIGGAAEVETAVSSTSATTCESFAKASYRSASIVAQITQGSSYQVGNYLLIHDGTTATLVEESAVATGDMLGTFTATISGSNVVFQVNMNSASSATVTSKMTKVSIP